MYWNRPHWPLWERRGESVLDRIMGYQSNGLIGLWPLAEASGTTVSCPNNPAMSVAAGHVGVTLRQPGPYGQICPLYDGVNDYSSIFSAALASAFNGQAGSVLILARVSSAGVWSDGLDRVLIELQADASTYCRIVKGAAANTLVHTYRVGASIKSVPLSISSTDFNMHSVTWDYAADQMKVYLNAGQIGSTQTSLGLWAGALGFARLGAWASTAYYSGYLSTVALFSRALTLAEIQGIYGGGPS